MFDAEIT
jgi:hypothetical protein